MVALIDTWPWCICYCLVWDNSVAETYAESSGSAGELHDYIVILV